MHKANHRTLFTFFLAFNSLWPITKSHIPICSLTASNQSGSHFSLSLSQWATSLHPSFCHLFLRFWFLLWPLKLSFCYLFLFANSAFFVMVKTLLSKILSPSLAFITDQTGSPFEIILPPMIPLLLLWVQLMLTRWFHPLLFPQQLPQIWKYIFYPQFFQLLLQRGSCPANGVFSNSVILGCSWQCFFFWNKFMCEAEQKKDCHVSVPSYLICNLKYNLWFTDMDFSKLLLKIALYCRQDTTCISYLCVWGDVFQHIWVLGVGRTWSIWDRHAACLLALSLNC